MTKKIKNDLFEKCYQNGGYFGDLRKADDHYYTQPIFESTPGPYMRWNNKKLLVWSVNDYLGLSGHAEIKKVSLDAVKEWGIGSPMGARMLTGNTQEHMDFENKLAAYIGMESAFTYSIGYLGMLSSITAMIEREDTVFIDSLVHSCIVDGAILAQAKSGQRIRPFKHNDMRDLEKQLQMVAAEGKGGALIVTEGVFGMHGDLGNLAKICELKEKYNARLLVDDAHGFGVMGKTGKGTAEHFDVIDQVDLYFSTFAKSFAGLGAFTAGPKAVVDYIRYNAKQSITTRCIPMSVIKTMSKTLDVIQEETWRREKMWEIAKLLQSGLKDLGFDLGSMQSPITPVHIAVKDNQQAMQVMKMLREDYNVFVSAIVYPIVPINTILLRLIPTAKHTEKEVEITLKAFKAVSEEDTL